jgi:hypothetical protein
MGPRRNDDRRVALTAIAVATLYLVLAVVAGVLGAAGMLPAGSAVWLPLHLALAGGASTAIAGVLPFFVAALAAGRPADSRLRVAAVGLVAGGAGLVAIHGFVPGGAPGPAALLPVVGGVVYLGGIAATAVCLRTAGRGGLAVKRPIVTLGYGLALFNVAIGATLGTLFVAGWPPVVERWAALRPAHAWTNLVGFVSVVIVATLVHFLPTALGTRIVPRRSAILGVLGIAGGSPLVVLGLAAGWPAVAGAGAIVTLVGVGALALESVRTARARGRWTTDPEWHLVAGVGMLAGVAWFVVGMVVASARLILPGAAAGAWSTPVVLVPLTLGWVVQVLIASWTQLLPSIGMGGPPEHRARRAILGRGGAVRLIALNAGVAVAALALSAQASVVAAIGLTAVGVAVLWSVVLAIIALRHRSTLVSP